MSASQLPAMQATALHAVACLQTYEEHVRQLVAGWLDMDLYQTVSAEIDNVKTCCSLLPGLAVPIAALLITHPQLVHCLWRNSQPGRQGGLSECDGRLRDHLNSIHVLSRKCLRIAGHPALH